ncbi:MAG: His/Gly/Thr/Pro-type tRNA ligase C-terminal domain-containing protein, partial [Bacteroidales bacterium]
GNLQLLTKIFEYQADNVAKLELLKKLLASSETGLKGLEEVQAILAYHANVGTINDVVLEITLARGLNYYTGAIFEVTARDIPFGSLCGGGRYDDLTGIFGMPGVSGVGISFGADRIYDVMKELGLFQEIPPVGSKVLLINFGGDDEMEAHRLLKTLRSNGIGSELYPEPAKIKKQMSYADGRKIPYVILAGEEERQQGKVTLKVMGSGEQMTITPDELIRKFQ